MSLAEEKLIELLTVWFMLVIHPAGWHPGPYLQTTHACLIPLPRQERELLRRHGVRVQIVGRLDLLPPKVQKAAALAMLETGHYDGGVLNICLCYTSRHDLGTAVGLAQQAGAGRTPSLGSLGPAATRARWLTTLLPPQAQREGVLRAEDLSPAVLDACLGTSPSPPVDLLVRTSGESRLSDYLLRQCATAHLVFLRVSCRPCSVSEQAGTPREKCPRPARRRSYGRICPSDTLPGRYCSSRRRTPT